MQNLHIKFNKHDLSILKSMILCLIITSGVFYIPNCFINRHITTGIITITISTLILTLTTLLNTSHISLTKNIIFLLLSIIIGGFSQYISTSLPILDNVYSLILCILFLLLSNWNFNNQTIRLYQIFIIAVALGMSIWGNLQYFHLVEIFFNNPSVTGSFDNPAGIGIFLATLFPFCIYQIRNNNKIIKVLSIFTSCILTTTVILSQSRTAFITIIIIAIWYLFIFIRSSKYTRINKCIVAILISFICIAILFYTYELKIDSAKGRLFIWHISWQMFKDNWLLGAGAGAFQAEYMLYQAEFFRLNPNSEFTMLADNVKHPFNEYLKLLIEYGLIGFLVFISYVVVIIRQYWLCRSNQNITPIFLSILAISISAFFSYPLKYPVINLILVINLSIINSICFKKICNKILTISLKTILFSTMCIISYFALNSSAAEYIWYKTAHSSLLGKGEENISVYVKLNKWLKNDGLFLYNYAAELNFIKQFTKSNAILHQCTPLFNDTDVQLLIADNHFKLKNYKKAEKHLILAHQMCPVRFYPIYQLFLLYIESGDSMKALETGKKILNKPIKISTPMIEFIKKDVENKLILISDYH